MLKQIKKIILGLVVLIIIVLGCFWALDRYTYQPEKPIAYGVTFSKDFAIYLGLDWKAAYLAILEDLKVGQIRLTTYWDQIEAEKDKYYFNDIDWQIEQAAKRNARLILVVGRRQPRWPECHDPAWVAGLSSQEVRQRLLKNIDLVVNRYKNNPAVEIWQVENEPFLDFFGECPKISRQELQEAIDLVKSLDSRQILLTDSGELSSWYPLIKMGDLFGTTLYRTTYNKYFGYWSYSFLPASFYRVKGFILGKTIESLIIAELQAEPWFPEAPLATPLDQQLKGMNAAKLIETANYARETNFSRAYFWGVEWWYWLKTAKSESSLWDAAKQYFK